MPRPGGNLNTFLEEMNEIEDFHRLMETIRYYHVDRCRRKNCNHCYFSAFYRIRRFINRLASLERKRLDLEQQFSQVLTNWNGAEGNMESPRFQING